MITRHRQVHVRRSRSGRLGPTARPVCPTCGWEPDTPADQVRLTEDLKTTWWSVDPDHRIRRSRHCVRCQPHQAHPVACRWCGDGPILTGELVPAAGVLPPVVAAELERLGWRPALDGAGLVCCG